MLFPQFRANARLKLAKTRHGPHSSTLVVICVVRLLFVLFYVLFVCKCVLPPGDNPIAVNKYINMVYDMTWLWYDVIWYYMTWYDRVRYDMIRYDMIYLTAVGLTPAAVVQYISTHKQYIEQHNLHKQYIEQHNSLNNTILRKTVSDSIIIYICK